MANDQADSAKASLRDVTDAEPGPAQDCSDIIHLSLYFDGTGNNRDADGPDKKWSNVARIYMAAQQYGSEDIPHYPIYISGVGTKFNGKAASWLSRAGIWIEDGFVGLGAGAGGDRRLDFGEETLNDSLREVLLANAKRLGGEVAAYAKRSEGKSFQEISQALSAHRLIKRINLSVFGFSRGAALARAFTNKLLRECEHTGEGLLYGGHPLTLRFMGLFDTVASFGLPSMNVQTPFSERDLIVPAMAERCVHFVAAHEVRFSFPVDLIRKNGVLDGSWTETVYPGVHSDVGGGYPPMDQGIDNNLARLPMRDMMREALLCGVKLKPYEEIAAENPAQFAERYQCRPETEALFRSYSSAAGVGSGTIEEQVRRHLAVYYSAYGSMHRRGIEGPGDRQRAASTFKSLGPKGMASEIDIYRKAAESAKTVRIGSADAQAYAQYVKPEQWQIDAWDTEAQEDIVKFVSTYIHDSKVDFLGNVEPFSYFRPRGIHESSVSVWRQASDWLEGTAIAAKQGVERMIEAGVSWIRQTASDSKKAAEHMRDKAEDIF